MIKCLEYNGRTYAQIFRPDIKMQFALLEECRGTLCGKDFEKAAGLPLGFITRIKNGVRKGVLTKFISQILNAADKKSTVTEEDLLISNGMIPYEKIQKVLNFLKPAEDDKKDLRRAEYAEAQFIKKHIFREDDYETFLDNLLFFSLYIPEQTIEKMLNIKKEIFMDKGFSRMLDRFRLLKESEISSRYDYLCQEEPDEEIRAGYASAEDYRIMILEQLEYF